MRRTVFILAALVLTLPGGPARAGAGEKPDARSKAKAKARAKARAKKLFRRGNILVRRKRYEKAVELFEKAYSLLKHPSILYNMASALALKGDTIKAAERLREFLKQRSMPKSDLPEVLQKVLEKTGVLTVEVGDEEAVIHIDGRRVGKGRVRVTVLAGERVVDIRRGSVVVAQKTVRVPPDKEKVWELAALPRPTPRPAPEDTPATAMPTPRPSPEPEPSDEEHQQGLGKLHWGYFASAAGLAVASLAGAVTASALTKQAKDENTQNPTPQTKDTGETRQLAANIMWGVTAATAAGAAVVAIFTRWKEGGEETPQPEDEAPEVTFSVVPGGAGLSVTW
jgi:hypothetical protein